MIPLPVVKVVSAVAVWSLVFLGSEGAFAQAPAVSTPEPVVITIDADHFRNSPGLSFERLLDRIESEIERLQTLGVFPAPRELDPYVVERGLKTFGRDVCEIGQYVCAFTGVATVKTVVGPIICAVGLVGFQVGKEHLDKRHIVIRPMPTAKKSRAEIRIVDLKREEAYRLLDYLHYDLTE